VHNRVTVNDITNGISIDASDTKGGWLVGAGIEYGFIPNWTIRVECDHIRLDDCDYSGLHSSVSTKDNITLSRRFDMLTVGLNDKFGGF
jgi:outer membrane immunogenic protein